MKNLKVLLTNLTFSEALVELKAKKFIKCPEWDGYWWLEATVLREDWQLVEIDKDWEEEQRNIILNRFK